ncbi:MAG TPA: DEAD/DEAH box helicase [Chitinophagales bacterium]|jgi:ATP-dependent RNA helicase DeaD|nr:DEAD/DEAH box helicase [Chitinophagales bacterium]MBP6154390.1 DEAD/DEAH box helicase [Chitinophagales bacterium]HQV77994.1 DEAD/DEAH box helicase [Chitinophagales bacterium]HQW78716.1 DEAD/DEAH box helicase [Chitinophagales bacterium]HRB67278.1 DEAD/DEAH box helicase [Chitinophagales bacterium]
MEGFRALGLSEEILDALEKKGYESPTPIQEQTIPLLLNGNLDIVGQAQTGTGKTAAFGLPILEKFDPTQKSVQALVLAPTRELAIQTAEEIKSFKGSKRIWITTVYGGSPIGAQMRELEKGTHVVVGTPGRVIDLIERKKLILDEVKYVVLDEADEMLNMGFIEDIELILKSCATERRMLLFSATMPDRILSLAKRYMGKYDMVQIAKKEITNVNIDQSYFEVPDRDKFDALCRVLDVEEDFYGIIFCNTKAEVVEISNHLNDKGYTSDALHGDIQQNLREKVVKQFKTNKYGVLVATDVAARGIDISDLTHVINYGLPQDPESYVHRIGRTGRAGKLGKAIAIISPSERRKLLFVERISKAKMKKGKLPDADDMVKIKTRRLTEHVETIIGTEHYSEYLELAAQLIGDNETNVIVAALIKHFAKDELNPKAYKQIKEAVQREEFSRDRFGDKGRRSNDRGERRDNRFGDRRDNRESAPRKRGGSSQRLFFAKGRADGMTPRALLDELKNTAGIESRRIDDIRILDNFSFFATNGDDAEQILAVYKRNKGNGKPMVDKARERDDR